MKTSRLKKIVIDPTLTLVIVESVEMQTTSTTIGGFMLGNIEPIAVVVRHREGITALDMQAKPVSVQNLRRDTPGLDAALS